MSVRWSSSHARSAAFALALLAGCGGESLRSLDDHSEPSDTGLGGATSTSARPFAGSATTAGGRQAVSAAGSTAGIPNASGGVGGRPSATGGGPTATAGVSGAESSAGMSSGGAASGGSDPPPTPTPEPPPPATWDTIKLVLTGTSPPCTGAACHGGSGGKIHLGFPVKNDAQLYKVLTEYVSKDCGNFPLVTPGHPEQSALVRVLESACSEDVPRMPNGCDDEQGNCVPDDYIAAVAQWIADGTKRP